MPDRLKKLKKLEKSLNKAMEGATPQTIAAIAKQYRETIREIDEIEGAEHTDDEIEDILSAREADGKSGAVRKSRA